ncbi:MAG: family 20 glycosylhydrolase [Bacteroidota bacterium]
MNRLIATLLVLLGLISVHAQCPIIPTPSVYQESEGSVNIAEEISIDPKFLPDDIKDYIAQLFPRLFKLRVVYSSAGRHVVFRPLINVPKDHYSINIADRIQINYSSDASCFYAVSSLIQLLQEQDGGYYVKKGFIQDQPKFEWRGLHLDVSRHFFSVEEVKRYIDLMAYYKFNTFHWHLTDDQGWRIEIRKYPKLTEIGAWRDSTVIGHYTDSPRKYEVKKYGGYYTQDEIREIVRYAGKRYITVVPEIEMPGHSRAALAAYPELSCTGKHQGVEGLWGVFDDIFCSKKESIDFLKDVLDEVLELFPSEYIHIGGDEAPKTRWKKCAACQKVIKENGLKDEHELQSYFIQQMDSYLTARGRKLIGWDEILEGGLSPNATVMSWRGFEGGIEAASLGHYVVMSPGSHCYFDHYQSKNPSEPLAIGGFTPLEKVYQFNPIAPQMSADEAAYVLGGQANLWTEYIPDMKKLEYMAYPRALALSQALWCMEKPDYELFKKSLVDYQLGFLDRLQVNYSRALFYPELQLKKSREGVKLHFKGSAEAYHFDVFTKSSEAPGTMGGGQVMSEKDTMNFERTQNKVVDYTFRVSSGFSAEASVFKFKAHPSIGLDVEYVTPPAERYNSGGTLTLVDGIVGVKPWKGNEWVGFNDQEIELIVDLGEKKSLTDIELNFLEDHGSWIHLPALIRYSVSANGKKWKYLKSARIETDQNPEKGKFLLYRSSLNKKGRYVKILITTYDQIPEGMPGAGNVAWTFMDELMIFTK